MLYWGKRARDGDCRTKRAMKEQAADFSLCIFDQPAVVVQFPYKGQFFFFWNKKKTLGFALRRNGFGKASL